MLADREKVWDAIVTSFHRLTGAETEGRSEAAPEVKPENGEGLKTGDKTLAFSLISYTLIVSLAVIYIHWKIGFAALYSFNNQAHFTHSVIAFIAVTFGIGALVCLIHLVGVIGNTLMLNNAASDFSFIDRTMQLRDSPNRTIGDRLFSDYTCKPKNGSDAFRLLNESLLHAILKIFTLPFSVGYLHPVITVVFAISYFLPQFISKRSLPDAWIAIWFTFLCILCYRAILFHTAKRNGIARMGGRGQNLLILTPASLTSSIQLAAEHGVTPEFIEQILDQEKIRNAIKNDLMKTGEIGYHETWRLGLLTPDQDRYDLRLNYLSRQERTEKYIEDVNTRYNFLNQLPYKRSAIIHSTSTFNIQLNNILITNGLIKHSSYPWWSYKLGTKLHEGEYIPLRELRIAGNSSFVQNRSLSLERFLREDGFPLRESYADGNPLTTERGGTIVIDRGNVIIVYPRSFVQRRIIDDQGDLVDIGVDEDLGPSAMGVTIKPAVFDTILRYVTTNGYIPILRYHSVPYKSEFMLPILDIPISASGWADLYIDPTGTAKLYIAREKTTAEWYDLMSRLKLLFESELIKKDFHILGLSKDKAQLNGYFGIKQELLKNFYEILNWRLW